MKGPFIRIFAENFTQVGWRRDDEIYILDDASLNGLFLNDFDFCLSTYLAGAGTGANYLETVDVQLEDINGNFFSIYSTNGFKSQRGFFRSIQLGQDPTLRISWNGNSTINSQTIFYWTLQMKLSPDLRNNV